MSRSPTITDEVWSDDPSDWLPNPHAGEIVRTEFVEPSGLTVDGLAENLGADVASFHDMIEGRVPIDAELDLRLGRYFRMSPGFFLGLQADHDLLEQRRRLGRALDRIIPRAA